MGNSQASASHTTNKSGNKSAQKTGTHSKLRLLGGRKGTKNEEWISVVPDTLETEKNTVQEPDNTPTVDLSVDVCRTDTSSDSNFFLLSSGMHLPENSTFIEEFQTPQEVKYSFLKNNETIDYSTPIKSELTLDNDEFQLLNNFKLNEYRARIDQDKAIKLSKLGITRTSQISLEQDGTSFSSGGVLEFDSEEQSNDEALENIHEAVEKHDNDQEQNHHTPPVYKRHMSVPLDCVLENNNNGSNLHKVQSFSRSELESRLQRPKFVPEKLDFKLYEKFEGYMLVNWYISELNPDDPAKSQLGIAELKLLAAQFCTHLLAAGVLKQLPDSGVPPTNIFRPDCIYYWSHAEIIQSQPQTPGRLSGIFWPPPASCEILASPNDCPDNTLHLVSQEKKSSARDVEILSLEEEIKRLQQEVEKYKTLIEIQNLTASAMEDFSSPTEENRKICDAVNRVSIKSTSDIATWISFYYNETSTQTELQVLNKEVQTISICTNEKEIQTEPEKTSPDQMFLQQANVPLPLPLPPTTLNVNNFSSTPNTSLLGPQPVLTAPPPPPPPPLPNFPSHSSSGTLIAPPLPPPIALLTHPKDDNQIFTEKPVPPLPPPLPTFIPAIPPPPAAPPPTVQSGGAFPTPPPPPPPPPVIHRDGPQPMPPPPPGGFSAQKAAIKKPPVNPPVPMKPLFWTRILLNAQTSVNDNESALWNEIEEIPYEEFSTDFTKLFSRQVSNRAPTKKKDEQKPKVEVVKLLESKRSQNIGILAQSLRQDFHEIEHAIYNFDTSIVNLEVLQQIYEVKPTIEELSLIYDHLKTHPEKPLDKPEQFIHDLSQIADYSDRIACLMFQVEFEDEITTIGHILDNFKSICQFLGRNEELKRLLSLVLSFGNYMNGGNVARGQADGFQVDILPKLKDVKGAQAGVTLLHFIVSAYVKFKYDEDSPPPLPVPEPGDVQRAMALDFESMKKELAVLKVKLRECERKTEKVINNSTSDNLHPFKNKMEMFIQKSSTELLTECDELEECHKLFIATMKLYLFKPKKGALQDFAPSGFFELWLPFCIDFKDIYKKEIVRLQIERAQELKQKTKPKIATIKERENCLKSKFFKAKKSLSSKEAPIIS